MGVWKLCPIVLALSSLLALAVQAVGHDGSRSPESSSTPVGKKEVKKRGKTLAKELGPAYETWLRNEVPEIITEEERRAFLELSTNEERQQFIETFWDRRNPDPESPVNAYKEEHYRRLAYADERFASGIPGRKTDRGHIYILWGPPDEIESHPTGGLVQPPAGARRRLDNDLSLGLVALSPPGRHWGECRD